MKKTSNTTRTPPTVKRVAKPDAEQFPPVSGLWYGCDESKPRNYDWSNGYGEQWESYEARACENCGAVVVNARDGGRHCDLDRETECGGHCGSAEGPMMNYFYPLPTYRGAASEDAKKLAHLPLCIVEFLGDDVEDDERYGLALTGGGMDLSWEICEAFMRLGYLPPVHFAGQLPEMAGRGTSKRDRWIIAGCQRSLRSTKEFVGRALRRLRENFPAEGAK